MTNIGMKNFTMIRYILFLFFSSLPCFLLAQSAVDGTVLQLNDRHFKVSDFEAYCANNRHTDGGENKKQCLEDYIVYCLKLVEAESQGIDRTPRFKAEMERFRSEIAAPYLNSNIINEELVDREWNRLMKVNDISSIHIPFDLKKSDDSAKEIFANDTLASYQKAMEIYAMCIKDNYFETSKESNVDYKPFDMGIVRALTTPMSMEDALYEMKVGDISKPIRTQYGYHILKINKQTVENQTAYTQQIKKNIINRLKQSDPALYYHPILEKMKAENDFLADNQLYLELQKAAEKLYPTSKEFLSKFETDKRTLFTADDQVSTVSDFILSLRLRNKGQFILSNEVLDESLRLFEYSTLSNLEDRKLEVRHPETNRLLDECRTNLLMLTLTDRGVREKAQSDTIGLKTFFEQNRNKYSWKKPRFKGFVMHAPTVTARENMQKEVENMDLESAYAYLNATYLPKNTKPEVKIGRKGLFIEGSDEYIDEIIFKSAKKGTPYLEYPRYFVVGKLINQPEDYTDVLSFVLDDYQKHVEKNWIDSLRKKYTIKVNDKLIKKL